MALAAVALLVGVVAGAWLPPSLFAALVVVWGVAVILCLRAGPVPATVAPIAGFMTGGVLLGATRHAAALETPLARWFAGGGASRDHPRRGPPGHRAVCRSAAIVTAVLIGDRAGLDDDTTRRLQEGGTYHVITISGGNIVILAGCLLLLGRLTGLRPRPLSGAVILLLVAYAYLVGHEASVARATVAAVMVLGAGLLDHRTQPVNVLAVAAIGIVLVSPLAVFDAGFMLTFVATLGIVLGVSKLAGALGRFLARWREPPPRWVALPTTLLAATLCAEGALMPIGVALFARVSLADPRIKHFFDGVDMQAQAGKQRIFLTYAFGGPVNYDGKDMRSAHKHLALTEEHFGAVAGRLQATLEQLNVPADLIGEVMTIAGSTHDDVLNL